MSLNQPFGFEFRVGVRHRGAMNAELPGQFAARGNAVAGAQLAGMHQRAQLVAQLNVQRNMAFGL